MPQASAETRDAWQGSDHDAIDFLKSRGYTLTRDWHWIEPETDYLVAPEEWAAINYLFEEWDFGGLRRKLDPVHDQQRAGK